MWLKEVVVDGFKSYAHRTVIGRFDCAFTAITGLNGTGKSNILDAICFVLGITNLQQVRASSLSELVYKAGQAGVTSASVSLLFDNSDAQRSPVGYAEYAELTVTRVVVLGGKNKYLINGQTAQLSRVLNLFHSVGLNVNNPHFLIMQGRITRVIGMKPAELLSLIEEAAGTRMFESKKQAAVRTIDKKQGKVEEINCILHSEIAPQLQQLREDQQLLAQFTSKKRQLEQLERVHVAFTYTQQLLANKAHAAQARQQALLCEEKERLIEAMEEDIARQSEEEEQLQTELREKQTKGRSSTTSSTDFSALEDAVTRLSKTLVQVTAEYSHAKEAAETEAASLNRLSAQAQQAEGEESAAQQNVEAMKAKMERAEEELKAAETELTECRSRELGVGLDGEQKMKRKGGKAARNEGEGDHEEGGAAGGLHGQLMAKQRALSQLDGQLNLVRLQLKEVQTNIDGAAASNRRGGKDRAEHDKLKRTIEQQRRSLNDIDQQITVSPLYTTLPPPLILLAPALPHLISFRASPVPPYPFPLFPPSVSVQLHRPDRPRRCRGATILAPGRGRAAASTADRAQRSFVPLRVQLRAAHPHLRPLHRAGDRRLPAPPPPTRDRPGSGDRSRRSLAERYRR